MAGQALNGERINGNDAPIHEAGQPTSSIGPIWPPQPYSHERVRGIYNGGVVQDFGDLRIIISEINKWRRDPLFGADIKGDENGFSRISLRAVVSNDLLMSRSNMLSPIVEAILPLEGTKDEFRGASLVYFGGNHKERSGSSSTVESNRKNLDLAMTKEAQEPQTLLKKATDNGYELAIVHAPDLQSGADAQTHFDELVEQFYRLYEPFNWKREEIVEMLKKENNIIGAVIKDGQIVSAGIMELAKIKIGATTLAMAEVTDAATLKEHTGKGLYSAVSTMLILELAARSSEGTLNGGEIDLLTGECNGQAPGVLITSIYQGRTYAARYGARLGYPQSGVLPYNVPILDPGEKAQENLKTYNHLFPTSLSKESMYNFLSRYQTFINEKNENRPLFTR